MHPEIWSYPHISSYSFFWLAAFLAGFLTARWAAKWRGIEGNHIDNVVLILLVIVPVGARWFSRVFYMPDLTFWETFKVWSGGGLVLYGGFIFGVAAVVIYAWARRIAVLGMLDVMAPAAAVGLAVGRIGCFMGGCCWGDVCVEPARLSGLEPTKREQIQSVPWVSGAEWRFSVEFPPKSAAFRQHQKLGLLEPQDDRSLPVHPVQLYEALLALCLATGLARNLKRWNTGQTVLLLAIGYAVIRFLTEFLRADNQAVYFGLTLSQVISGCILLIACALGWIFRKTNLRCPADQVTAPEPVQHV